MPADLAPGDYKMYCWNGFGDVGWSEQAHALTVVAPATPRKVVEVKQLGAVGDGETDDTAAFDQALAQAAPTGGKVLVAPGQYLISHTLALPEGVSLVGVGAESCTLTASPYREFTGEIPERGGPDARRHARAEDHVRGDDRGPAGENLRGAGGAQLPAARGPRGDLRHLPA